MTLRHVLSGLFVSFIAVASLGACSSLADECKKATVTPDGTCSEDALQCEYDLQQDNCDGTFSTVATSCVCTGGAWSCPDPIPCPAPVDDAATE
jgi:hypothetical protein